VKKGQPLRRSLRDSLNAPVEILWQDQHGTPCVCRGRCVDISQHGLGLVLDEPIPLRSYVQFTIRSLGVQGSGSVRSVQRSGLKQLVGLEFSGALRWNPEKGSLEFSSTSGRTAPPAAARPPSRKI